MAVSGSDTETAGTSNVAIRKLSLSAIQHFGVQNATPILARRQGRLSMKLLIHTFSCPRTGFILLQFGLKLFIGIFRSNICYILHLSILHVCPSYSVHQFKTGA